jgi:hypothetical protein
MKTFIATKSTQMICVVEIGFSDRGTNNRRGHSALEDRVSKHLDQALFKAGNQEVADWVCAGLDILGLVCVGVFASVCAVTESVA